MYSGGGIIPNTAWEPGYQSSYKKYIAIKTHPNTQEIGATGSYHFSLLIAYLKLLSAYLSLAATLRSQVCTKKIQKPANQNQWQLAMH